MASPTGADRDSDLTGNVRAEIDAFFGAAARADPARPRGGYGRLIADLEARITDSLADVDAPPPELGPFIIEQQIGRGGFAVVYRATHKRTGARAAVKIVPVRDRESRERVDVEVHSLARLQHPNIVKVLDTGRDESFAWIATDYVEGQTLAEYIRGQRPHTSFHIDEQGAETQRKAAPAPPDAIRRAITWFRDLASALEALHGIGLVHRDVKPANILLDTQMRPYLIDFGLSSSAESTVSGILAGTVPYMSPEQTLGGYVAMTPRSDLYALAATFHEVLTGQRVTRSVRRDAILHEIAFVPVPPPSTVAAGVPADLDAIFAKALQKDSHQRYVSARALGEDLDRWLAGKNLVHVKEPWRVRAGRVVRRHRVATLMIALMALAALGFGAWNVLTRERAYRDLLVGVQTAVDEHRPLDALTMLADGAERFGGRADFRRQYREAVLVGGDAFVQDFLREQAFAVRQLADQSRHARVAAAAERHLASSGTVEPDFVLVCAVSKLLARQPSEARTILERYPQATRGSRTLAEVAALIALEENDADAYAAAMSRLQATPFDRTTSATCLRAWRVIWCMRGPESMPRPDAAEVAKVLEELDALLEHEPDHAMARALKGILRLRNREYQAARDEFEQILMKPQAAADRLGTVLMAGVSGLLAAGVASDAVADRLPETPIRYIKDAVSKQPALLPWAMGEIVDGPLEGHVRFVAEALGGKWDHRPELGPLFLRFAGIAIQRLAAAGDATGRITHLSRLVDAEYGQRITPEIADTGAAIFEFEVFDMRRQIEAARSDDVAAAKALAADARDRFKQMRARLGDLPYPLVAQEALVAATQAALEQPPASGHAMENEAVALLRAAIEPQAVARALDDAADGPGRDYIKNLSETCTRQLRMLESAAESRSSSGQ